MLTFIRFMKQLLLSITLCIPLLSFAADSSDTNIIKQHLTTITKTKGFRNHKNTDLLNATAAYVQSEFAKYSGNVTVQEYTVKGKDYKNVLCSFGPADAKRIIVGAHYDVCGDQQGADDNASGITGLLELARMLKDKPLTYRIDLVAYTLEEPPYYNEVEMGSYVHAKSLADDHVAVYGMVSLEMIGYFKDAKHTQSYPLKPLKMLYGSRGNYITLVRKPGSGKFAARFARAFKRSHEIRTVKFTAPAILPGIDFSDHRSYWHFHFSALMITDTAFLRNKSYHEATDVMEALDFGRMANVIDGVYKALQDLQ